MMAHEYEKLFPVAEELRISFVASSPLGNGFLTGRYDQSSKFEQGTDYRSFMPRYTEEGFARSRELLDLLNELAEKKAGSAFHAACSKQDHFCVSPTNALSRKHTFRSLVAPKSWNIPFTPSVTHRKSFSPSNWNFQVW